MKGIVWFDQYDRHARGAPGLLVLLPVAVVGIVLGLQTNPAVAAIGGAVVAAGGPLVLAGWVRQRGLAVEASLLKEWGMFPTTRLLLLSQPSDNARLRDERRRQVERVTGVALLNEQAERVDLASARQAIETAVASMRERTRDTTKFGLVAAENRNYGFERNMLGLKKVGIAIGAISSATLAVATIAAATTGHVRIEHPLGLLSTLVLLAAWIVYPSSARVERTAEKYGERLLDAANVL